MVLQRTSPSRFLFADRCLRHDAAYSPRMFGLSQYDMLPTSCKGSDLSVQNLTFLIYHAVCFHRKSRERPPWVHENDCLSLHKYAY